MGGENLLGFAKAVRAELGVQAGDELQVQIVLDTTRPEALSPGRPRAESIPDPSSEGVGWSPTVTRSSAGSRMPRRR